MKQSQTNSLSASHGQAGVQPFSGKPGSTTCSSYLAGEKPSPQMWWLHLPPPSFLHIPSLLASSGQSGEKEKAVALCKLCSAAAGRVVNTGAQTQSTIPWIILLVCVLSFILIQKLNTLWLFIFKEVSQHLVHSYINICCVLRWDPPAVL